MKKKIYFNYILSIGVKDDDQKKLKRKSLKKSENKKLSNIIEKMEKHILTTLYQWSLHEWWLQKLKYKKNKIEKKFKKIEKKIWKKLKKLGLIYFYFIKRVHKNDDHRNDGWRIH